MSNYIDCGVILDRKCGPLMYVYMMIIIIILLSLIIFCILFKYKTFYDVKGIVIKENEFYIKVYVPLEKIQYLSSNNVVRIDRENYRYVIISFEEEYVTDNIDTYQVVKLKIDLPSKYEFNNLTLSLKFLQNDKRIIDYIIRR